MHVGKLAALPTKPTGVMPSRDSQRCLLMGSVQRLSRARSTRVRLSFKFTRLIAGFALRLHQARQNEWHANKPAISGCEVEAFTIEGGPGGEGADLAKLTLGAT